MYKKSMLKILRIRQLFYIFISCLMLFSCDKSGNLVPAFIIINKEDITIRSSLFAGVTAQDFSDVWVTVNGQSLGCWELPAKIPVLETGNCNLIVNVGIKMNGVTSTRPVYPFVNSYKIKSIDIEPNDEIHLKPVFTYYDDIIFPVRENFENAGIVLIPGADSETDIITKITDQNLIYKNPWDSNDVNYNSGLIELKDTATYFEIETDELTLGTTNYYTFCELNYKTEGTIGVSLIVINSSGTRTSNPIAMYNASPNEWKKAYVNLTQALIRNYTASSFKIQIMGYREEDASNAKFYLDNIRVVQESYSE